MTLNDLECPEMNSGLRFATTQTKWNRVEPERGDRIYDKMDEIVEYFNRMDIPISGNTLLWEANNGTRGHTCGTPTWYQNELTGYIEKNESAEPLRPEVLSYVRDTVQRYSSKVKSYKIFNEPLHGDEYRANYENIWQEAYQ